MASVIAKNYKCECVEEFDGDTGASEGCIECIGCATANGYCECTCDCGQCTYTAEPCGFKPPDEPCQFCLTRLSWEAEKAEDPLHELAPIISEVRLKIDQAKDDLATGETPGKFSHEYLRKRLDQRLLPCLMALVMIENKSAWASSVIDEVKNVLRLEGFTEGRKYCGIPNCECHLRVLKGLVADKMGDEFKSLHNQKVAAEDLMHLTEKGVAKFLEALDDAKFQKRVAIEMVDEHKWESELDPAVDGELQDLEEVLLAKQAAEDEAEAAYAASKTYFKAAYTAYRQIGVL